jgi:hypothetical protein
MIDGSSAAAISGQRMDQVEDWVAKRVEFELSSDFPSLQ